MTSPSTSIRDNPRPDLRRKLLDSAERMFAAKAYADVRVDDIASDAGVAKGLVYYHFDGKRGLYSAVLQAMAEDMLERTDPDLSLPFYESAAGALDGLISWAVDIESFSNTVTGGPGADQELSAIYERSLEQLVDRVLAGMRMVAAELNVERELDSVAMRHALKGWVAGVYQVTLDWLAKRDMTAVELRDLHLLQLTGAINAGREAAANS